MFAQPVYNSPVETLRQSSVIEELTTVYMDAVTIRPRLVSSIDAQQTTFEVNVLGAADSIMLLPFWKYLFSL